MDTNNNNNKNAWHSESDIWNFTFLSSFGTSFLYLTYFLLFLCFHVCSQYHYFSIYQIVDEFLLCIKPLLGDFNIYWHFLLMLLLKSIISSSATGKWKPEILVTGKYMMIFLFKLRGHSYNWDNAACDYLFTQHSAHLQCLLYVRICYISFWIME